MKRIVRAVAVGGTAATLAVGLMAPSAHADTSELRLIRCWESTSNGTWSAYCAPGNGGVAIPAGYCQGSADLCEWMKYEWIDNVCHTVRDLPSATGSCDSV